MAKKVNANDKMIKWMNGIGSMEVAEIKPSIPTIHFRGNDDIEILRLEPNGDIFVNGKLIENDKQVTDGLRHFLTSHGY
jgi:hypothetical protein